MKYRFIGKDSLGYKNGKVYNLVMTPDVSWVKMRSALVGESPLAIRKKFYLINDGFCPYSSVEAFNANWEEVK